MAAAYRGDKLFVDYTGDTVPVIIDRLTGKMRSLNGPQLLIPDDWGLDQLDGGARRDLYEILEERSGRRSTILTSQLPVDKWHEIIGNPTYAAAILDRLVHKAHRINLDGESLRRTRPKSAVKD